MERDISRRTALASAGAALTTSLFTGRIKGANDRITIGFIGIGAMGSGNLDFAMRIPEVQPVAVCISTPDHWHAYMTVEACKAGKDVFVEKPACKFVEEGQKMVQAARKYNRIVQAGTMQRS